MKRWAAPALALLIGLSAVPVAAQVTQDDLDRARRLLRDVAADLEDEAVRYEAAVQQEERLRRELEEGFAELSVRERELAVARLAARDRIVVMYMLGLAHIEAVAVFDIDAFEDLPARQGYIHTLAAADRAVINGLMAARQSYLEQLDHLQGVVDDQEELRGELAALTEFLSAELAAADAEYRSLVAQWEEEERRRAEEERRRAEEERRRAATSTTTTATSTTTTVAVTTTSVPATTTTTPSTTTTTTTAPSTSTTTTAAPSTTITTTAPSTTTTTLLPGTTTTTTVPPPTDATMVCPVDGATVFIDTYGALRPGGRFHEGIDMMAARGTPVVAIEAGTVFRMGSDSALGGITVWLRSPSGDEYYYAHLDGWAEGLAIGQSVGTADPLGFVGSSGNASYLFPHLHFEMHPGGDAPVNPYVTLKALCG